jgi:nitrite reductase/ring-hydroxylating ferredoxin subunit
MKHELFPADELGRGHMRSVRVDGIAILILRKPDGTFRALRDVCPHHGVPLSRGTIQQAIDGDDVGDYVVTDNIVARCSWHSFEFDSESGRCIADPNWRVKAYPVSVVDGVVVLDR